MNAYELLAKNLAELQALLKDFESILRRLNGEREEPVLERCYFGCPRRQRMQEALLEAIRVLEESRKAFKSKQLEGLRKQLIEVLAEAA